MRILPVLRSSNLHGTDGFESVNESYIYPNVSNNDNVELCFTILVSPKDSALKHERVLEKDLVGVAGV